MPSSFPVEFLVYGAGDAAGITSFGSLANPIARQVKELSRVACNKRLWAAYQLDDDSRTTRRRVLLPARHPQARKHNRNLEETNTGDPTELLEFIKWCRNGWNADLTVLALSGHGLAWQDEKTERALRGRLQGRGVETRGQILRSHAQVPNDAIVNPRRIFGRRRNAETIERMLTHAEKNALSGRGLLASTTRNGVLTKSILVDGSSSDYLSNIELESVVKSIASLLGRPIDVLLLDACLMSSLEVLTSLQGAVRAVVASVDELSAKGFNFYGAAQIISKLPQPHYGQVAKSFPESFQPGPSYDSCIAINLDSPEWIVMMDHFRTFCRISRGWLNSHPKEKDAVVASLQLTGTLRKFADESISDLSQLAFSLSKIEELPGAAKQSLANVIGIAESTLILGRKTGGAYDGCTGISLFVPKNFSQFEMNIRDYRELRFSSVSGWGRLLESLFMNA